MTFIVTRQRAQEVHDRAMARDGLPYGYGGAFTHDLRRSTDCSGLVLQTAAWYGGRTDWVGNRYGSTESFRLNHKIVYDLGFKRMPAGGPAALPFKPVMLVGLQHGGGGIYSHTACTLMTMDRPGGPDEVGERPCVQPELRTDVDGDTPGPGELGQTQHLVLDERRSSGACPQGGGEHGQPSRGTKGHVPHTTERPARGPDGAACGTTKLGAGTCRRRGGRCSILR